VPYIKPICLKLVHYPILFKIAKSKCICPEYHVLYYPQLHPQLPQIYPQFPQYYPQIPFQLQQPLKTQVSTAKPIKQRLTTPDLVYRPVKTKENFTEVEIATNHQAFNFRPTTTAPQIFNFRVTAPKYQKHTETAKPQSLVSFGSISAVSAVSFTKAFTGYSLNYHPSTPPGPTEQPPVFGYPTVPEAHSPFGLQDFMEVPPIAPANPVIKLDVVSS
jgi:hypothetical protein